MCLALICSVAAPTFASICSREPLNTVGPVGPVECVAGVGHSHFAFRPGGGAGVNDATLETGGNRLLLRPKSATDCAAPSPPP